MKKKKSQVNAFTRKIENVPVKKDFGLKIQLCTFVFFKEFSKCCVAKTIKLNGSRHFIVSCNVSF